MKRMAAAFLVLCVLFGAGAVRGEQEPSPSITVVGSGRAAAPPDTAEVAAGVVTQAATAGQALTQNSAAMDRVLKALTGLGIAERDVRTSGVNVMPQRADPQPGRRPAPAIVGYEVTNEVRVKVRNIALLGRLLDVLVVQGANSLGGIAFSVADPAPLLTEARTRAIADARRKADVYATAAGVKVGRVIFIRDATPEMPRFASARVALSGGGVPVAPGEQELEVSVSVTYGLE
jgi:uncharacterized protein YggE